MASASDGMHIVVTWEVDTLGAHPWPRGLQDLCGTFGGGLDVASLELPEDFQDCCQGNPDQLLLPVVPILGEFCPYP